MASIRLANKAVFLNSLAATIKPRTLLQLRGSAFFGYGNFDYLFIMKQCNFLPHLHVNLNQIKFNFIDQCSPRVNQISRFRVKTAKIGVGI